MDRRNRWGREAEREGYRYPCRTDPGHCIARRASWWDIDVHHSAQGARRIDEHGPHLG